MTATSLASASAKRAKVKVKKQSKLWDINYVTLRPTKPKVRRTPAMNLLVSHIKKDLKGMTIKAVSEKHAVAYPFVYRISKGDTFKDVEAAA
jgi:hypothetical protein